MNAKTYLKRALFAGDARPDWTWGYVLRRDGKRIAATTDGYRIHLWWTENWTTTGDDQHLVARIPFDGSIPLADGSTSEKVHVNLQALLDASMTREYPLVLKCSAKQLRAALPRKNVPCALLITGDAVLLLDNRSHLAALNSQIIHAPRTPMWFGFNGRFLRDAIRPKQDTVTLRCAPDDPVPFCVGDPGVYGALIMRMSLHLPETDYPKLGGDAFKRLVQTIIEKEQSDAE